VEGSEILWLCALAPACLAAACLPAPERPYLTPLGIAVLGYAGWLMLTNIWINPYTSAATYDAGFLVAGFLIGRRAGRETATMLFGLALAFAVGVALWSIWQRSTGAELRGRALFETPATLAAILNLMLVPGLALVAAGKHNRWLIGALVVLTGALIGTLSRGGWIALIAACLTGLILLRRAALGVDRKSAGIVAAIFAAGYLLSLVAPLTWQSTVGTVPDSASMRLALYQAATDAIRDGSWTLGSGYLSFRYVLEAARPTIFGYREATTYFVHDDYLQALLELGIPGLVFLLLIAVLPSVVAWRALPALAPEWRLGAVALAAATVSMAAHAIVDFPFHIEVCLLIYGACAGLLAAWITEDAKSAEPRPALIQLRRLTVVALATVSVWLLARPALAEAIVDYAKYQWATGRGESAAYWIEIAERLESADWRYHWYAGQFWYANAQALNNAAAARLADQAFAAGLAANPRAVQNLLWRISAHIDLRPLLPAPADRATLRAWGDRALALAPLDPGVSLQRDLIRKFEAGEATR
jgi:O-antigen ligase